MTLNADRWRGKSIGIPGVQYKSEHLQNRLELTYTVDLKAHDDISCTLDLGGPREKRMIKIDRIIAEKMTSKAGESFSSRAEMAKTENSSSTLRTRGS